jgi:hypothetical protein
MDGYKSRNGAKDAQVMRGATDGTTIGVCKYNFLHSNKFSYSYFVIINLLG